MRQYTVSYIKADIDYGFAEALTTYGIIGVKVWIYKGELMAKDVEKEKGKGEKCYSQSELNLESIQRQIMEMLQEQ